MTLQRYDIYHDSFDINVSLSKKVSPCGEWMKADDAERLEKRVEELEKALKTCHGRHQFPIQCAELVDALYHELFSDEYNPHKHWSERK